MLSLGLIGIFVGPVVLAVTYTLMLAWIDDGLGEEEPETVPLPTPVPMPESLQLPQPNPAEPTAG